MARKATDIVPIMLRIREDLRRRLEREATRHKVSLNREMQMRLEDSFEIDARRSNESVAADLETNALRLGALVARMELSEQLAEKLAAKAGEDPEIAALVNAWRMIKRQEGQQQ
jgi:HicB family